MFGGGGGRTDSIFAARVGAAALRCWRCPRGVAASLGQKLNGVVWRLFRSNVFLQSAPFYHAPTAPPYLPPLELVLLPAATDESARATALAPIPLEAGRDASPPLFILFRTPPRRAKKTPTVPPPSLVERASPSLASKRRKRAHALLCRPPTTPSLLQLLIQLCRQTSEQHALNFLDFSSFYDFWSMYNPITIPLCQCCHSFTVFTVVRLYTSAANRSLQSTLLFQCDREHMHSVPAPGAVQELLQQTALGTQSTRTLPQQVVVLLEETPVRCKSAWHGHYFVMLPPAAHGRAAAGNPVNSSDSLNPPIVTTQKTAPLFLRTPPSIALPCPSHHSCLRPSYGCALDAASMGGHLQARR